MNSYTKAGVSLMFLFTCACAAQGDVTDKQGAISEIKAGMPAQEVVARLGNPGVVYEESSAYKVLNYCSTGLMSDTYYKIHLENNVVTNVEQTQGMYVDGSCGLAYNQATPYNTKSDHMKCEEYGFKKGTKDYADCRMKQEQNGMMREQMAIDANQVSEQRKANYQMQMLQLQEAMKPKPLAPVNQSVTCHSTRYGNSVTTNCN